MRDFALIFRHAWELARKGADTFGGSPVITFASHFCWLSQLKRNVTAKDQNYDRSLHVNEPNPKKLTPNLKTNCKEHRP
jgi:hypothetical protein